MPPAIRFRPDGLASAIPRKPVSPQREYRASLFVKRFAERVDNGMLGPYVDVETIFDLAEGTPQHHVFKVLRVRNNTHAITSGRYDVVTGTVAAPLELKDNGV